MKVSASQRALNEADARVYDVYLLVFGLLDDTVFASLPSDQRSAIERSSESLFILPQSQIRLMYVSDAAAAVLVAATSFKSRFLSNDCCV